MSQDSQKCVKCGNLCGYDDTKGYWLGGNMAICGRCKGNLINRFTAFFGIDGSSSENTGLIVEWPDVDRILSHIQRDVAMRVSYVVTDKALYEKTIVSPTPVEME